MKIIGPFRCAGRQRGVVLLIALIALIAISLAGVALMRTVDTGLLISGNLAFKQTAVQAADIGTEAAIAWLDTQNSTDLGADLPGNGFYADWHEGCDLQGDWWNDPAPPLPCNMLPAAVSAADLPAGFKANYVINRMCDGAGMPNPNDPSSLPNCLGFSSKSSTDGSTKAGSSYGDTPIKGNAKATYRITTRVEGPRNTVSFIQTVVAF